MKYSTWLVVAVGAVLCTWSGSARAASNAVFYGSSGGETIRVGEWWDSSDGRWEYAACINTTWTPSIWPVTGASDTIVVWAYGGNDTVIMQRSSVSACSHTLEAIGHSTGVLPGTGNIDIYGGAGLDSISGCEASEDIWGDADADSIWGYGGGDYIDGGSGDDDLNGMTGMDQLQGGLGDDILDGGSGDDLLYGGDGSGDELYGMTGDDCLEDDAWAVCNCDGGYYDVDSCAGGSPVACESSRDHCFGR